MIGFEKNEYVPLRLPGDDYDKVVDLLFVRDENGNSHYACVKNMSRLISSSCTKRGHKTYFCRYCLSHCGKEHLWKAHTRLCSKLEFTKVEMPEKGSVSKFRDFETMHKKVEITYGQTQLGSEHVPVACSIVDVSDLPEFQIGPYNYVGPEAGKKFVTQLERIHDKFYLKYQFSKPMVFGEKEQEKHDAQDSCYICKDKFGFEHEKGPKVRGHCHFTGAKGFGKFLSSFII